MDPDTASALALTLSLGVPVLAILVAVVLAVARPRGRLGLVHRGLHGRRAHARAGPRDPRDVVGADGPSATSTRAPARSGSS
ncbi:hypothetical protein [Clavibacter zhangzhiyongii]|uniref:hypothetical protein n=1 Tax=Clavibacter zhangzhiyongii TaxID=2768071 RepID=UPI0039E08288